MTCPYITCIYTKAFFLKVAAFHFPSSLSCIHSALTHAHAYYLTHKHTILPSFISAPCISHSLFFKSSHNNVLLFSNIYVKVLTSKLCYTKFHKQQPHKAIPVYIQSAITQHPEYISLKETTGFSLKEHANKSFLKGKMRVAT